MIMNDAECTIQGDTIAVKEIAEDLIINADIISIAGIRVRTSKMEDV